MARVNLGTDSSGRPLILDDRTLAKLRTAEDALGFTFTIVQGSWRGEHGASASAGTHDRGGVIDLRSWNLPRGIGLTTALTALRRAGLIAWHRTKAQGFDPHIHAVDYGNPDLSPSAARQVVAWEHGRNGLANNGPDDGPRVTIPKNPPTGGLSMADVQKILDAIADLKAIVVAQNKEDDAANADLRDKVKPAVGRIEADLADGPKP